MCGLFGMMGPGITKRDTEFLYNLAIVSQIRGLDGFGISQFHQRESNPKVFKSADDFNYHAIKKFEAAEKKDLFNSLFDSVFMCHVRAATVGEVLVKNAHPFTTNKYIIAHNGTLVESKYRHGKDNYCDSYYLSKDIDKRGLQTVLEELDSKSAFAITLWDKKEKMMSFTHNSLRPLAFAINKHRSVVYWASEKNMLEWLLGRHQIEAEVFNLKVDTIAKLPVENIKANKQEIFYVTELNYKKSETKEPEQKDKPVVTKLPKPSKESKIDTSARFKQFFATCIHCKNRMNLIQQYKGHQNADGTTVCYDCVSGVNKYKTGVNIH